MFVAAIMIGILNIFRFLSFNRRFSIMWLTLSKAGLDLFVFIILFAVVCAAFVCAGNIIYGTHIYGFSRANLAIITTFLGMVDGLDFDELYTAQRICTPIYFILFTIIIVFILVKKTST